MPDLVPVSGKFSALYCINSITYRGPTPHCYGGTIIESNPRGTQLSSAEHDVKQTGETLDKLTATVDITTKKLPTETNKKRRGERQEKEPIIQ